MGSILVYTTRSCFINGTVHAAGDPVKLPAAAAWEAVQGGFARFADPADSDVARAAFVQTQREQLARLGDSPSRHRGDFGPWRLIA